MKMQSLGREKRLGRPAEFAEVQRNGISNRGSLLIVGSKVAPQEEGFRVGFVTSKRVGGAVVRNRIRRRLREIVRRHQDQVLPGVWIVTIARAAAARASYGALEDEWLRLARRASILAPDAPADQNSD